MTSAFFQISSKEYLQALRIYDNPGKDFALRIITSQNGLDNYIYLPDVTLHELGILASILQLKMMPNIRHVSDLRMFGISRGYGAYPAQ